MFFKFHFIKSINIVGMNRYILITAMLLTYSYMPHAQGIRKEILPLADFENWHTRVVKESNIVGGDSCHVYYIAPSGTTRQKGNLGLDTPWASSNVYAEITGVTKVNVNVFPEPGLSGRCAALHNALMSFRVMGMKYNVVTVGAIFTGKIDEPVKSMDDAFATIDMGIPFTQKPNFLFFDYKSIIQNSGSVTEANGFRVKNRKGSDRAQVLVLLQKRWEEDGKIYSKRVGTAEMFIDKSTDWVTEQKLRISYGKPLSESTYSKRAQLSSIFFADNSNGKRVAINEVGWASPGDKPTHLILYVSSGSFDVYAAEMGNVLYLDNIGFGYVEN